jgi:hypothetical protein
MLGKPESGFFFNPLKKKSPHWRKIGLTPPLIGLSGS